eukprot:6212071-Pleurochrysis_carterae.AAC.6
MAERVVERVCASVGEGARERVCWRRVAEKRGQQAVQTSGMRRLVATLVVLRRERKFEREFGESV